MADALKAIAALRNEWGGYVLGDAAQAIHTVLSTLVAEREARARRDERVREAAGELTKRLEGWGDQESSAYARIGAPSPRSLRRWRRTGGERAEKGLDDL